MKFRQTRARWVRLCLVIMLFALEGSVVLCDGDGDAGDAAGDADKDDHSHDSMSDSGSSDGDAIMKDTLDDVGPEPRFKFDPLNPKNIALVSWAGAMDETDTDDDVDYVTVGTFIATNVIVCVPSVRVAIRIQNTSNWYAHHLVIGQPPTTIDKTEFVVFYHEKFQMSRDSAHRLAMLVLTERGEAKATGMIPLAITAIPFLPTIVLTRHDDFVLQMCSLIVYEATPTSKFVAIPFVAMACRFNRRAVSVYKEKICGYTKMMSQPREVISEGIMFPNDLGAPLICGNVLVGVYSGIQNLNGNRYASNNIAITDLSLNLSPDKMGKGEQYTFDVPGGLENYKFLSGFVDGEAKQMKWTMKMPMHESNECIEVHEDQENADNETEQGAGLGEQRTGITEEEAGLAEQEAEIATQGAEITTQDAGIPEKEAGLAEQKAETPESQATTTVQTVPS